MNCSNRILSCSLILGTVSLVGCSFLSTVPKQSSSATPIAASPAPLPPPSASPTPMASTPPFAVLTAPPFAQQRLVPASPAPDSVRENYACLTANYFADVVWQQDQPKISFGRKPSETATRDALATVKSNSDGSFTYEVAQASLFYTRIYPDRTCLLQIVNPTSGIATLEENGHLGNLVFDDSTQLK